MLGWSFYQNSPHYICQKASNYIAFDGYISTLKALNMFVFWNYSEIIIGGCGEIII